MKVLKFGGSSLATADRMLKVLTICHKHQNVILVLSAVQGTTDLLQAIADHFKAGQKNNAKNSLNYLKNFYTTYINDLNLDVLNKGRAEKYVSDIYEKIAQTDINFNSRSDENLILSFGEKISTYLAFLKSSEIYPGDFQLLDALQFMQLDNSHEPDTKAISNNLQKVLDNNLSSYYITQGYISMNSRGMTDNLMRGGSDYTASLIGEAINASEIQIWTDIDGLHNNDPRVIEDTRPIRHLSYNEAAELAYFGAKILHPQCIYPAQRSGIPVQLKYTMDPAARGTQISEQTKGRGIKAIAAKEGITAIKIKSYRMLMAYGFLRKVFEIFENHQTSIDMITTSEVAVSLTIDNSVALPQIIRDLKPLGELEIDPDQSIICIVGDLIAESKGYASKIFQALEGIPVRMVSYGGSKHNVSLLVNHENKTEALQALHNELFKIPSHVE